MIVVAAGMIARDGQILLAQRKPSGRLPLKWEFPGGKLEAGETPQQALRRELMEELGIATGGERLFDARINESGEILILFYLTSILSGTPAPLDANQIKWIAPPDMKDYDLAPTDRQVALRLADEWRRWFDG